MTVPQIGQTANEAQDLAKIKRQSVTGAFSYFVRTLLLQGLGFVSIGVLSAFFTPEDFAVYGVVVVIMGLLVFFSDIGLAAALVQQKNQPTDSEYKTAFTVQQILSWLIVGVALLLVKSGVIAQKTGPAGEWILMALAISFPLATLKTIPSIILERKLQFSKLVIPAIAEQIVFHSLLIGLAWQGVGVVAYAYAIIFRSLIGVVVMNRLQTWSFGLELSRSALKQLLSFGVKFQVNDFLARIKDQLFYLVLGWWLPLREFGYIQWAKNWSMYPYNLTVQNVMAVTFPAFSRLQAHPKALSRAIEISLFFITLLIFPIIIGMSLVVGPIIELAPVYAKWQPAILSFIFFSLSIGWSAIATPLTNTLNAIGQINKTLKLMLMWTGLTWVLTPLAIFKFGYNGVAVAAFIISLTSFMAIVMVKKVVEIQVWSQVWRQLLACLVMALVGWLGQGLLAQSWFNLALGIFGLGIIYVGFVLITGWQKVTKEFVGIIKHAKST
ncbi:MAG: oligosaccharide flippase family protein [Patescibacteria group bacterium]